MSSRDLPPHERREFQRLLVLEQIDGSFGSTPVRLVDVSATGARIEHEGSMNLDQRERLRFDWRGETIEVLAQTTRIDQNHSGLHFLEECDAMRRFITASATEILRARIANALGDRDPRLGATDALDRRTGEREWGYITYTFTDGAWSHNSSPVPDQPPNGFTISAEESDEQVQLLCRTYEAGDVESRKMTRLLAELSVAAVEEHDS